MKKSQFTDQQIAFALKQAETQGRISKLGESTKTNIDTIPLWVTWPPNISLHRAERPAR